MTRLPTETWDVVALPGEPAYELNLQCAAPGCMEPGEEDHHIWPRSFTKDASAYWVSVKGYKAPCRVALCNRHHRQITGGIGGHEAHIVYAENHVFYWVSREELARGEASMPLLPQPGPGPMQLTVDGVEIPHDHVVGQNGQTTKCPRCKGEGTIVKQEKAAKSEQQEARPKVTWAVRVPKDEREDGYEVLDGLMDGCIDLLVDAKMIRDRNKGANYYALVAALAYFQQNFNPKTMGEGA